MLRLMLSGALALTAVAGFARDETELAAMRAFYGSEDPKAKTCAKYAALVAEAHDALAQGASAEAAAKQLDEKYRKHATSKDAQARLSRVTTTSSRLAFALRALSKDGAVIAHMQLCRHQADGWTPKPADLPGIERRLQIAERCEKDSLGEQRRKECVARAFGATE